MELMTAFDPAETRVSAEISNRSSPLEETANRSSEALTGKTAVILFMNFEAANKLQISSVVTFLSDAFHFTLRTACGSLTAARRDSIFDQVKAVLPVP